MVDKKKIKKELKKLASKKPEKFFPINALESYGFKRYQCKKCGTWFWSTVPRDVCGDTSCVGGYSFIGNTPAKKPMNFSEVYLKFRGLMEKRGYKHVDRFPIVARWRNDLDFNIASIIGFQPYVTKGIVLPPAPEVIIPQNCLRFEDIDNVGYTGRHGTNFVMIGQAAFRAPEEYDQERYFKDLLDWFIEVMKIPIGEIQIHEDAWVGGGDCGPSMEFFSRGLELANQVYMWFDMSNAEDVSQIKPLKLKVLDMGMGLERCCWFSKGSLNQYEASMPLVSKYLFEKTGVKPNLEIYKKFLPYSGLLNLDEVEDIDEVWLDISKKLDISVEDLRKEVEPIVAIYSIADHTKTLLYALSDGALPSNVKGGYNLRLVFRRALDFVYKFGWEKKIDIEEVLKLHAKEMKELYPEYLNKVGEVYKILDYERDKYLKHREKIVNKVLRLKDKVGKFNVDNFIKLAVSEGITPYEIKDILKAYNVKLSVPPNFFVKVQEFFSKEKKVESNKNSKFIDFVKRILPTELLYYKDMELSETTSKILKEFDFDGKHYIILDKTIFYPEMGGQIYDTGFIGNYRVVKVFKVDNVIIHEVVKK